MIDLKIIHPSNLSVKDQGFSSELQALLHCNTELPRVTTLKFQNMKCGIIIVDGLMELFSFINTSVPSRAKKVDFLAVWFKGEFSYPKNSLSEPSYRENLSEIYKDSKDYHALGFYMKQFISGIEMSLIRRVVAIGQEIEIPCPDKEELGCVCPPTYERRWLHIPKNRIPIYSTPS